VLTEKLHQAESVAAVLQMYDEVGDGVKALPL